MIQINDVVKSFDGFRALDGLTMKVEEGSIYGLVGPNGAGKSTILRHIMGICRIPALSWSTARMCMKTRPLRRRWRPSRMSSTTSTLPLPGT